MPYRMQWTPAPKDESLIVHKEKPEGRSYKCRYCDGWIEGQPNRYKIDTLALLAGRRGTEEYCRRCGQKIRFFGVIS